MPKHAKKTPKAPSLSPALAEWRDSLGKNVLDPKTIVKVNDFMDLETALNGTLSARSLSTFYKKIAVPDKPKSGITFTAFTATSISDADVEGIDKIDTATYSQKSIAGDCAEAELWQSLSSELKGKNYLGIGQTLRPCLRCSARFKALAGKRNINILIWFKDGSDQLLGNRWLFFSRVGPTVYSLPEK